MKDPGVINKVNLFGFVVGFGEVVVVVWCCCGVLKVDKFFVIEVFVSSNKASCPFRSPKLLTLT